MGAGTPGPAGPSGIRGDTGPLGAKGDKGDKGDTGNIGDANAVKAAMQPNTLWCADGDFCKLPNKKGIQGNGDFNIQLASKNGIVFSNEDHDDWTGVNLKRRDGRWTHFDWKDDQNNYIRGDTHVDGKLFIGGWQIYEDGDQLIFKRGDAKQGDDNAPHIRFAGDSNIWTNRSSGKGWIADNIGQSVRLDRQYFIRSNRGGMLIDGGGWSGNKGDWETMKFEQK
jgi:hypothetical protein